MPLNLFRRYARWLHTQWPAGRVERLPDVRPDGSTSVPGLYVAGELTGFPFLRQAAESGESVVRTLAARLGETPSPEAGIPDLIILGAGVCGVSASMEAEKLGLRYRIFEAAQPFATLAGYPPERRVYVYPGARETAGQLRFGERARVKEGLLTELSEQLQKSGVRVEPGEADRVEREGKALCVHLRDGAVHRARFVLAALGRSGSFRRLGIPGEDLHHVFRRLYDPVDFAGKNVLVVGGADSAVETAVCLARAGAHVTLSHRGERLTRPKLDLLKDLRSLEGANLSVKLGTQPAAITPDRVRLKRSDGPEEDVAADAVFLMVGRESSSAFFRKSGAALRGDWKASTWFGLGLFLAFCFFLYDWKSYNEVLPLYQIFENRGWFPFNLPDVISNLSGKWADLAESRGSLVRTLAVSASKPAFYYTLIYSACIALFGWLRIRRTPTPYVKWQTYTFTIIQFVPLFLLPEIVLPWAGDNGWFAHGTLGGKLADLFFEPYDTMGYDRAYWRSYGFVFAWPLFVWNIFTDRPMAGWLGVSLLQTFVLLPILVRKFGKGVYCGWICSCGALDATLADTFRRKMPHGPFWNRLNLLGQWILMAVFLLLILRVVGWIFPVSGAEGVFLFFFREFPVLHYSWFVDIFLCGILGVGLYFWFSGRTWCRFACPLAALLHIYARFSRFRIFADRKKCISCGECTAICNMGVDVMGFASKGIPMEDPECVRCSSCIAVCPTNVLSFGEIDAKTGAVLKTTRLPARAN